MFKLLRVRVIVTLAFLCFSFILSSHSNIVSAATGINHQINFQGKLVNTDGTNVTDGTYTVVFGIYNVASAGSAIWTETQSVVVSNGIFQVNLGSVTTLPGSIDFNTDNIYLGIKVGSDAEMTPRIQFTAVPQAFNSEKLGGLDKTGFIQNTTSQQASSNFNISGTGVAGTSLTTPLLQSAAATALNITGNAASTWSTSAGNLTLQAGSGTVSLGTSTSLTAGSTLAVTSGGATVLSVDTGGAAALNIGNGNANAVSISKAGVTTTVNGSLTVAQAGTFSGTGTGLIVSNNASIGGNAVIGNQNIISFTRTIPTTVNNEVDLGSFAFTAGGGNIQVTVVVPSVGYSVAKQYLIPVAYNATGNTWQIVQPISDTGPYGSNDTALEINVNSSTASLRLRRTVGTTAGTAYVTINQSGVPTDGFTASTATSSVTAPTTYYGAAILSQLNGGASVQGTLAVSGATNINGALTLNNTGYINTNSTSAFKVENSTGNTNVLVADTTNGRIGINKINPNTALDIGGAAASGTIGTQSLFQLTRPVNGGVSYPQVASFNIGSYAVNSAGNGYGPNTRLDISLKNTANGVEAADTNVLTLQSNGQVGINGTPVSGNGTLTVGTNTTTASGGLYLGTDTNLYRNAANTLMTDSSLQVNGTAGIGQFQNYIANSETIGGTGWTNVGSYAPVVNSTTAPDGNSTATKLLQNGTTTNSFTQQGITLNSIASPYTASVWAKSGNVSQVLFGIYDYTTAAWVNFQAFTTTNNWQRFSVTGTPVATGHNIVMIIYENNSTDVTAGDYVYVWGAQAVSGSAPLVYNRTAGTANLSLQNGLVTNGNLSVSNNATIGGTLAVSTLGTSGSSLLCYNASNQVSACGSSVGNGSYIYNGTTTQSANFNVQAATSGSVAGVLQANATGTGDILDLKDGAGNLVHSVTSTGNELIKPSTDSTTAFQVQNAAGTSNLLVADTTNTRIGLGVVPVTTAGTGLLQVGASGSTTAVQGISFGGDTAANLYRSAANTLKTDGALSVGTTATIGTGLTVTSGDATISAGGVIANKNSTATSGTLVANTFTVVGAPTTAASSSFYASQSRSYYSGTASTSSNLIGSWGYSLQNAGAGINVGGTYGVYGESNNASAGTIGTAVGTYGLVDNALASTGTITNAYALMAKVANNSTAGANFGQAIGLYVVQPTSSATATIGSAYGIFIGPQSQTGVTNAYGLYQAGSNDLNVLNGNTTFGGTLAVTGATNLTGLLTANGGITATGNINTTGQYQISGTQISSANLSNDANLAKLNGTGPQTFTGNNKFTGTLLAQNASNSTTAFQIQNAGSNNLLQVDTTNNSLTVNSGVGGALQPWQTASNLPATALYYVSSVIANGYLYEFGGYNGTAYQTTVSYTKLGANGVPGAWSTTTSLPIAEGYTGAVVVNGYVYVVGGWTGGASQKVYSARINADGTLGSWNTLNNLPGARGTEQHVVTYNGIIYEVGGEISPASAASTVYYATANPDGTVSSWNTASNPLPLGRYNAGTVAANGYLYEIGGYDGSAAVSTVYYSKINTDGSPGTWNTTTSLPSAQQGHSAVTANGYIYTSQYSAQAGSYASLNSDGTIGSWTSLGSTPNLIANPGIAEYNGTIYEVGGNSATNALYYASIPRLQVNGALDLIGSGGTSQSAADSGLGGELTAGNTNVLGQLNVQGSANILQNFMVSGSSLFRPTTDSTTAFQIQNAAGTSNLLVADSTNGRVGIGGTPANGVLTVGSNTTTASGGLYLGTDTNLYRLTTNWLKTDSVLTVAGASTGLSISAPNGGIQAITGSGSGALLVSATGDTGNRLLVYGNGKVNWGDGTNAVDTNLYRLGVSLLNTDQSLLVQGSGNSNQFQAGSSTYNAGSITQTTTAITGAGTTFTAAMVGATIVYSDQTTGIITAYTDATHITSSVSKTIAVSSLYNIYYGGLSINGTGSAQFENTTNSTSAFKIQNAAGTSNLFIADTTNTRIGIGSNAPAYMLDIAGTSSASQLHVNNSSADTGGYFTSGGSNLVLSANAAYNGANWVAKGTSAVSIDVNSTNGFQFYGNTGLTAGNTYTPTQVARITNTGAASFQNSANSTTAFQIQNAAGSKLLQIDTANNNITLGGNNSGELQTWQTNANVLPNTLGFATSVVANGYIYEIGGYNGSAAQSTVYYAKLNSDGSVGTWSTAATALPAGRYGASSVVANGYVYVMGGAITGNVVQSTVYYAKLNSDGSVGTWSTASNALPQTLSGSDAIVANGYVYMMGGNNGTSDTSTVYYAKLNSDGSIGSWVVNANALTQTLHAASSVVANGYVYVIGGVATPTTQSTVYYAKLNSDGSVGTWTTAANALPQARAGTSVVANGYVYELGGTSGAVANSTVYYAKLNSDGSVGTWTTAANALPQARNVATSVVANGYVYELGGYNASSVYQSTVYYASTQRLQLGGSLDLVGLSGQNLTDGTGYGGGQGSVGGSLMAGNTNIVGVLQVQGAANFAQGVSINGPLSVNNSVTFQNTTDSASAFQVQNAAGTQVLNVDTTNSLLTVRGSNSSATLGTERMASTTNFTSNWSGANWTFSATNAVHTAGVGFTAPAVYAGFTPVASTTYQVTFTFSGASGNGTDAITPSIGGASGQPIYAASDTNETQLITTTGTGSLQFNPTANWNGTITSVSVKIVTKANSALSVLDSSGSVGLEVRVSNANNNTFLGVLSGSADTVGILNTALGVSSLQNNTTGSYNTANGYNALQFNTTGYFNTAIGYNALQANTTGYFNTATGFNALQANTTGSNNTTLGYQAGYTSVSANANTTGSNNTFLGYNSGPGSTTQLQNATAIGTYATVSQNDSLVLGCISGVNGCTTSTSVGIGTATPTATLDVRGNALFKNSADSNTAFQVQNAAGTQVLNVDTTNSLVSVRGANSNATLGPERITNGTFTGNATGWTLGSGWAYNSNAVTKSPGIAGVLQQNVSAVNGETYQVVYTVSAWSAGCFTPTIGGQVGTKVCFDVTTGVPYTDTQLISATGTGNFRLTGDATFNGTVDNVSVMKVTKANSALSVQDANGNPGLEVRTYYNGNNLFLGYASGSSNTSGASNMAVGIQALQNNTTGSNNTASGDFALQNNTTGSYNNASGYGTLTYNTTGFANNASGYYALPNNTTGSYNNASGFYGLEVNTTGSGNTASGAYALTGNTTGSYNTALGFQAGYSSIAANASTTGSNNTFLGYNSGPGVASAVSLQNATAIGESSVVNANDTLILGCNFGVNGCAASTRVGISSGGYANNALTVSAGTSNTGTISQSASTAIVGTSTAFTSGMVGGMIYYSDGNNDTIATYTDATHITTTSSHSESGNYTIVWGGVNVTLNGAVSLQNTADSTTAFQIQNALNTTTLFKADTSNSVITIAGNPTTFASLTLANAHFKVTQTNMPTIATPGTCGTTPTSALAASAADSAGSFRITSGTGAQGICTVVISFNKAFGAAPKSIIVVPETNDGGTGTAAARQVYVSAASSTTFTVKYTSAPAGASEVDWFYYWVVE